MSVFFTRRGAAPISNKMLGDFAVGESVFLKMNGVSVEHIVANHGIPGGSSLYDSSCNGTWLIPKDIVELRQFHNATNYVYQNSAIHSYLNNGYLAKFDSAVQGAIKQVKIPHTTLSGINGVLHSGANGLSTKCFLLGNSEVGANTSESYIWNDGACLELFSGINSNAAAAKRIANYNGAATKWWLRPPHLSSYYAANVQADGSIYYTNITTSTIGIRPAIILPTTAIFDAKGNFVSA